MLKAQLCWKSPHLILTRKTRLALPGEARLSLVYALVHSPVEGLVEGSGVRKNDLAGERLA